MNGRQARSTLGGWVDYPIYSPSGRFVEELDLLAFLLGSVLYEWRSYAYGLFEVRRIAP